MVTHITTFGYTQELVILLIVVSSTCYGLHYERRHIDGTVYRHNNAPHKKHQHVKTFPKHFRRVGEDRVEESYLPEDPIEAIEYFLRFTLSLIRAKQRLLYQLTN